MDELSTKLNEILNDEESMARFKSLAENLLSSENKSDNGDISSNEIKTVMGIINRIKSTGDDKRTALLTALKPNLSPEKQERVDTAVKLLKLIEILPYLRESGILNIL